MLAIMLQQTHLRARLVAMAAVALLLAGCGVPPLHRSVVVENNGNAVPAHATGKIAGNNRYTVVRGDTLYGIAVRANVDYRKLARWNGIGAPYVLHPGQVLQLSRPHELPSQPASAPVPVFRTARSGTSAPAKPAPVFKTVPSKKANADTGTPPAVPASTVVAVAGQPPVAAPAHDTAASAEPSAQPPPAPRATRRVGGITWRWPATGKVLGRFDASEAIPGITIGGHTGDPVRAAADGVVVYSGDGLVGYGELVVIRHNKDYLSIYGHNSKRLVKEGEHVEAGQMIAHMGATGASRDELEFQVRYKGKPVDPVKYLPAR
jgi:lipoprotein NlpD